MVINAVRAAKSSRAAALQGPLRDKDADFKLSGHGHFDMAAYENYFSGNMQDFAYSDADLQASLKSLPNVDWPPKAA
jgi:hypothetical protein